jgi:RNA polymerase sigma factor (sigma-70 family)
VSANKSEDWLDRFHAGDREVLTEIYRRHFATLARTGAALLGPSDGEAVTHDLFVRLLDDPDLRRSYRGGAFGAWLLVIGRNAAVSQLRRRRCEGRVSRALQLMECARDRDRWIDAASDARLLVERFREHVVPPAWRELFELRFVGRLSQDECAVALGLPRTTLAAREHKLRTLLRRFLAATPPATRRDPVARAA